MSSRPSAPSRRRVLVSLVFAVACVVVCAVVLALVARGRPVVWTATSDVVYGADPTNALIVDQASDPDIQRTIATQTQLVLGDRVMSRSARVLDISQAALVKVTAVSDAADSNVISISTEGPTPVVAAARAQTVAKQYVAVLKLTAVSSLASQAKALDSPISTLRTEVALAGRSGRSLNAQAVQQSLTALLQQQFQLKAAATAEQGPAQVVTVAVPPTSPSSISAGTGAVVGAGVGVVLALGLLLLADWWSRGGPRARTDSML